MGQYFSLPIIVFLTILYILTYFLYLDKTITYRFYKLLWNIVLIISSIIVAIIGIVMVIYINLEILPIDNTILFWHVEMGIITTLTGIFHIHIYWKQFKKIFK